MTRERHAPAPRLVAKVGLIAFVWLAALAGARPLLLPDEGRYVGVAWEMLRSGDWSTPTLDGLPYFHKPPLFYWVTAASMALFGAGDWAARAAPLLGAWAGAMATFVFVCRWWGVRLASLALSALLAMPLFYLAAQFANLDMLVAGCITATIVLLAHAALSFESGIEHRPALIAGYAAAALGLLAKGLIGVLFPVLVVGGWLVLEKRWRTLWALLSLPGALVCAGIAAPWFIVMQARFPGFLDYFFIVQHFKRFATGGFNNVQPWWFFVAVLALLSLPWLAWLRPHVVRDGLSDPTRRSLRRLMWLWAGTVVVFFSLPQSKLIGYILPALPPLAVLLADGFEQLDAKRRKRSMSHWYGAAAIGAAVSFAAVAVMSLHPTKSTRELAATLRAEHAPGEPVVMIREYRFDMPLYARLQQPVVVVDAWRSAEVQRRDNWRKELADAGAFAPTLAQDLLLEPARLCPALRGEGRAWVVAQTDVAQRFPFIDAMPAIATVRGTSLWRVDRADPRLTAGLSCEGTPNAD